MVPSLVLPLCFIVVHTLGFEISEIDMPGGINQITKTGKIDSYIPIKSGKLNQPEHMFSFDEFRRSSEFDSLKSRRSLHSRRRRRHKRQTRPSPFYFPRSSRMGMRGQLMSPFNRMSRTSRRGSSRGRPVGSRQLGIKRFSQSLSKPLNTGTSTTANLLQRQNPPPQQPPPSRKGNNSKGGPMVNLIRPQRPNAMGQGQGTRYPGKPLQQTPLQQNLRNNRNLRNRNVRNRNVRNRNARNRNVRNRNVRNRNMQPTMSGNLVQKQTFRSLSNKQQLRVQQRAGRQQQTSILQRKQRRNLNNQPSRGQSRTAPRQQKVSRQKLTPIGQTPVSQQEARVQPQQMMILNQVAGQTRTLNQQLASRQQQVFRQPEVAQQQVKRKQMMRSRQLLKLQAFRRRNTTPTVPEFPAIAANTETIAKQQQLQQNPIPRLSSLHVPYGFVKGDVREDMRLKPTLNLWASGRKPSRGLKPGFGRPMVNGETAGTENNMLKRVGRHRSRKVFRNVGIPPQQRYSHQAQLKKPRQQSDMNRLRARMMRHRQAGQHVDIRIQRPQMHISKSQKENRRNLPQMGMQGRSLLKKDRRDLPQMGMHGRNLLKGNRRDIPQIGMHGQHLLKEDRRDLPQMGMHGQNLLKEHRRDLSQVGMHRHSLLKENRRGLPQMGMRGQRFLKENRRDLPQMGMHGPNPQKENHMDLPQMGMHGQNVLKENRRNLPQMGMHGPNPQKEIHGDLSQMGMYRSNPHKEIRTDLQVPQMDRYSTNPRKDILGDVPQMGMYRSNPQNENHRDLPQVGMFGSNSQNENRRDRSLLSRNLPPTGMYRSNRKETRRDPTQMGLYGLNSQKEIRGDLPQLGGHLHQMGVFRSTPRNEFHGDVHVQQMNNDMYRSNPQVDIHRDRPQLDLRGSLTQVGMYSSQPHMDVRGTRPQRQRYQYVSTPQVDAYPSETPMYRSYTPSDNIITTPNSQSDIAEPGLNIDVNTNEASARSSFNEPAHMHDPTSMSNIDGSANLNSLNDFNRPVNVIDTFTNDQYGLTNDNLQANSNGPSGDRILHGSASHSSGIEATGPLPMMEGLPGGHDGRHTMDAALGSTGVSGLPDLSQAGIAGDFHGGHHVDAYQQLPLMGANGPEQMIDANGIPYRFNLNEQTHMLDVNEPHPSSHSHMMHFSGHMHMDPSAANQMPEFPALQRYPETHMNTSEAPPIEERPQSLGLMESPPSHSMMDSNPDSSHPAVHSQHVNQQTNLNQEGASTGGTQIRSPVEPTVEIARIRGPTRRMDSHSMGMHRQDSHNLDIHRHASENLPPIKSKTTTSASTGRIDAMTTRTNLNGSPLMNNQDPYHQPDINVEIQILDLSHSIAPGAQAVPDNAHYNHAMDPQRQSHITNDMTLANDHGVMLHQDMGQNEYMDPINSVLSQDPFVDIGMKTAWQDVSGGHPSNDVGIQGGVIQSELPSLDVLVGASLNNAPQSSMEPQLAGNIIQGMDMNVNPHHIEGHAVYITDNAAAMEIQQMVDNIHHRMEHF